VAVVFWRAADSEITLTSLHGVDYSVHLNKMPNLGFISVSEPGFVRFSVDIKVFDNAIREQKLFSVLNGLDLGGCQGASGLKSPSECNVFHFGEYIHLKLGKSSIIWNLGIVRWVRSGSDIANGAPDKLRRGLSHIFNSGRELVGNPDNLNQIFRNRSVLFSLWTKRERCNMGSYLYPCAFRGGNMVGLFESSLRRSSTSPSRLASFARLPSDYEASQPGDADQPPARVSIPNYCGPFDGLVPGWRVATGAGLILLGFGLYSYGYWSRKRWAGWVALSAIAPIVIGSIIWLTGHTDCPAEQPEYHRLFQHSGIIVQQKHLTAECFRYTVIT